ncbi:bifunctional diguanylate cyclase/phosphodiesterase [Clostridioides difficile]
MKTKNFKNIPFLLTVFVDILMVIAVFYLMNYVQHLLQSDVKINLTEIVTQNKDVITNKLMMEVNNLDLASNQVSERFSQSEDRSQDSLKSIFLQYSKEKNDDNFFLASKDGNAIFPNGKELDISGRHYFKLALDGIQNISERIVSRLDGEDIFVISVPLKYQGKIIGSIQKQYTLKEMYNLCSVSLFSEKGRMYIINSQGYILINSQENIYSRESDNYYRMIFLQNPEISKRLENDIKNNRSGIMETELNGEKFFSAYTPIDQVYDWYLISSVSTDAVSANTNIVIKLFYFILLAVVMFFGFSMIYFLYLKDKQQAKLKRIAFVDTITQGNTYAKFEFDLQNLLQANTNKQFYIFTFDIDNFKYINNFYGFDVGDKILKKINEIYTKKLSENEQIARVYSDHFVILLEDASEKKLNTIFDSELNIDGITVYLSAGLYPITNRKESINLMIDKSNMAAQKIKGMRYKRVEIYSEEFDKQMIHNEQIKRAVEKALDNDEIIPFFQPKVDINSHKLVGAEALARWITKDGKLRPPGEFISVCEKTGLITAVDMTIFEKTLKFIKRNLENGIDCVPISVNFSRMHFLNKDFLNILLQKLDEYKVPPHLIELELTETIIFDNYEMIEEFINKVHENKLQISMDDFGSGYSSLHMLKDIDIDVLKIDRGFLKDTANSNKQKAVFAAITQMARSLNIKVVVEGVENIENVKLMQEFGCSIAQGYFYSKPINEQDFEKLYQEGKI